MGANATGGPAVSRAISRHPVRHRRGWPHPATESWQAMAMSRDPETIQREIERARDALAGTLDQLAGRFNLKAVADRGKRAILARLQSPAGMAVVGVTAGLTLLLVVRRARRR